MPFKITLKPQPQLLTNNRQPFILNPSATHFNPSGPSFPPTLRARCQWVGESPDLGRRLLKSRFQGRILTVPCSRPLFETLAHLLTLDRAHRSPSPWGLGPTPTLDDPIRGRIRSRYGSVSENGSVPYQKLSHNRERFPRSRLR
ncbi:hypothetical protein JTE90_009764 [Oedothorax gibbosus]|uniref:GAR domain-containing protein n=1 Tax=Oedothorax gibbosus TaxID=931172 RepID=A0AAV6V9F3_9ARAC|nr:hypothetical protein JTE90_009764 [Oedothorax gibbosus]